MTVDHLTPKCKRGSKARVSHFEIKMRGNEFVFSTPFFHLFCHLHERTSGQIPFKPKWTFLVGPNFIFHARKEFVIITTLVLQDPGQDGIREPRAWMDLYNRKALGS